MKHNSLDFLNIKVLLSDEAYFIKPFNTSAEKDILIMRSFDIDDVNQYLRRLGFENPQDLGENDKKVLLWKFREVSHGEEIDIRFKCKGCNSVNETSIKTSNFVIESQINDSDVKKLDKEVNDENLSLFLYITEEDLNNLDLIDYENLMKRVKDNQHRYDFTKIKKCMMCGQEHFFNLGGTEYILNSLSDETLETIYKTYVNLTYHGKLTKHDIDSMYPFERTLFTGLLHSIKDKENSGN